MSNCTIEERGNGFPGIGDYVAGDDGQMYLITGMASHIHTGQASGCSNYVYATVEMADWDDVDENFESCGIAIVGTDESNEG